jgi:hypothetical protein
MRMSLTQHLRLVVVQRGQHVAGVGEAAHRQLLARQAFSSTKRMDWSSSTIQMGFMRRFEQGVPPAKRTDGPITAAESVS